MRARFFHIKDLKAIDEGTSRELVARMAPLVPMRRPPFGWKSVSKPWGLSPQESENWHLVWGWDRPLVSSAASKLKINREMLARARQRLAAAARATAKAQITAKGKRDEEFNAMYKKVRKCTLKRREMGSISDLLKAAGTAKAKQVRSTIGQKMGNTWPRKWNWPSSEYGTHAACAARSGGGQEGHCATAKVLSDIYDFVKPLPLPR